MKPLSALLAVSLFFLAQDTRAQENSVSCEFQVAATVSDSKTHEVVRGLSDTAFLVRSGRSEFRSKSASLVAVDRVLILIDVSGSVTKSSSLDYAVRATDELLSAVPGNIPLVVVPFAEQFETIEQRKLVAPFLQKLASTTDRPLGKRTRLYDILVAVARAQKLSLNDAVIIISDLDDNSSKTDRITAENTFRRLGVRPAFILLPNPIPGTFEGQQLFRDVQYFANNTAGFYMSFPGPRPTAKAILPPIFYEQALAYYRLTFSSGSLEVNHVKVIVLDSSGKKMPHVEIRSSDAFQECHPNPS